MNVVRQGRFRCTHQPCPIKSITPKGVISLHHHPSKRMMARQFRVVLCGGMADDGDNFAAPSPIKTNDGAAISRCMAWWNDKMAGVTLLHHHPSKRMMALRFRVVLRGGMADDGGNFAAPSPSKRMMVLRFRVVLCGGRASQRLLMTAVSDAS